MLRETSHVQQRPCDRGGNAGSLNGQADPGPCCHVSCQSSRLSGGDVFLVQGAKGDGARMGGHRLVTVPQADFQQHCRNARPL